MGVRVRVRVRSATIAMRVRRCWAALVVMRPWKLAIGFGGNRWAMLSSVGVGGKLVQIIWIDNVIIQINWIYEFCMGWPDENRRLGFSNKEARAWRASWLAYWILSAGHIGVSLDPIKLCHPLSGWLHGPHLCQKVARPCYCTLKCFNQA